MPQNAHGISTIASLHLPSEQEDNTTPKKLPSCLFFEQPTKTESHVPSKLRNQTQVPNHDVASANEARAEMESDNEFVFQRLRATLKAQSIFRRTVS